MTAVARALAGLLAGAVLGAGCTLPGQVEGPVELTATFDDVGDLVTGHSVQVADVRVGSITRIELTEDLARGPLAFGYAAATVDQEPDGAWVRVNLLADPGGEPAEQYIPPRSLPAVPIVAACDSPLVAAGVTPATPSRPTHAAGASATEGAAAGADRTARPSSSEAPERSPLAVTGAAVAIALAAVLAVAALALWQARRGPTPGPP